MPVGPSASDQDMQHEQIPTCSFLVTANGVTLVSDSNLAAQFNCGFATELCVESGGTVTAVLLNDAGNPQTYYVPAGGFLHGAWVTVKAAGTTATGIVARR